MTAVLQRMLLILAAMAFGLGAIACEPPAAAASADCVAEVSEAAGHYEGDSDQQSHGGKESAHHHAPCAGHAASSARIDANSVPFTTVRSFPMPDEDAWRPRAHVSQALRPPIA